MEQDLTKIKQALARAVEKKRESDMNDADARLRAKLMETIGADIVSSLQPILKELASNSTGTKDSFLQELKDVIKQIKIEVPEIKIPTIDVNIPDIILPDIQVPKAQVDVKIPEIRVSDIVSRIKMPEEMSVKGWVSLMGVDMNNPLPVQLRDKDGKPVNLFENLTTLVSQGGGGGKQDYFTIKGFSQSAYSEMMNADGRVRVSVETGGSGLTDNELRASSVPVEQVSGSTWSTNVVSIFGSTVASDVLNADNRIRVSVETGGSGLTDSELRASSVPVEQVSGSSWSTAVLTMPAVVVTSITNTTASNIVDSTGVAYTGSNPLPVVVTSGGTATTAVQNLDGDGNYRGTFPIEGTVTVSDITASVKSALIDSTGVQYSGSNPVPVSGSVSVSGSITSTGAYLLDGEGNYRGTIPVEGTIAVSGITNSVASSIIDSSGVQYSGTNPVPVIMVAGSVSSTVVVGPTASDSQDNDSAPVKIGGIARTENPTPVSGGDAVSASYDSIGRQIIRPVQVRGLLVTAYASLTNGTETTLVSAVSGAYLDLVYIMGANNSDVAVTVDIRPVTAGNVVMTLQVPASGTAGIACPIPLPQNDIGNNWTADMGDITGTTVYLTGLFSKEV